MRTNVDPKNLLTHFQFKEKAATHFFEFAPQHCAWVVRELDLVSERSPYGKGSELAPWRMEEIGQWAAAAKHDLQPWKEVKSQDVAALPKRSSNRGLYLVGGRLMERTPSGVYSDYISDVIDGGRALVQPNSNQVTNIGRPRGFKAPERGGQHVYDTKYERIEVAISKKGFSIDSIAINQMLAYQARAILRGENSLTPIIKELPGTVTAMFLAEVKREPRMLVLGLMLLDLIEAGVPGFTWNSLMTHEGEKLAGGIQHPMIHHGAQSEARHMFEQFNEVTRKSVQILTAWIYEYTKKNGAGWDMELCYGKKNPNKLLTRINQAGRETLALEEMPDGKKGGSIWRLYHEAMLPALKARAQTLRFML